MAEQGGGPCRLLPPLQEEGEKTEAARSGGGDSRRQGVRPRLMASGGEACDPFRVPDFSPLTEGKE